MRMKEIKMKIKMKKRWWRRNDEANDNEDSRAK